MRLSYRERWEACSSTFPVLCASDDNNRRTVLGFCWLGFASQQAEGSLPLFFVVVKSQLSRGANIQWIDPSSNDVTSTCDRWEGELIRSRLRLMCSTHRPLTGFEGTVCVCCCFLFPQKNRGTARREREPV